MSVMFQSIKPCATLLDHLFAFRAFIKARDRFYCTLSRLMFGKANKSTIFIFIKENINYAD